MSKQNTNTPAPVEETTTALATLKQYNFDLIPLSGEIGEIFAEEMDGLGTIPFDLIKIPSGGGLAFELPGETDDNPTSAPSITGIIVDHHPINAHWETEFDGSKNPPDCSSFDGKSAIDATSGELRQCASCPLNQFGSDPKGGNGKACKNMHRIYILLSGQPIPMLLILPPTSLAAWRNYLGKKIVARGKRPWMVMTKITLKREKNANGIAYSQAVFTKVAELTPAECAAIKPMAETFRALTRSDAMKSADTFTDGTAEAAPGETFTEVTGDEPLPFD